MKKIHVLPFLIGFVSIVWASMALQRWWVVYKDPSQLTLALIIAVIGMGGAYVYNWMRNKDEEDAKQTERLDALVMWWTKQEKLEVRNRARGKK